MALKQPNRGDLSIWLGFTKLFTKKIVIIVLQLNFSSVSIHGKKDYNRVIWPICIRKHGKLYIRNSCLYNDYQLFLKFIFQLRFAVFLCIKN